MCCCVRNVIASFDGTCVASLSSVVLLFTCSCRYRDRAASRLSGGNKRKLSLALALLGHPRVIVLDEVSAGVDAHAKRRLWKFLAQYNESTRAVRQIVWLCVLREGRGGKAVLVAARVARQDRLYARRTEGMYDVQSRSSMRLRTSSLRERRTDAVRLLANQCLMHWLHGLHWWHPRWLGG